MPKAFAVELYFDPALENQVLKIWNVLARRKISSHLIEMEARPHIRVFSSFSIDPAKLRQAVKAFAARQEPITITFSALGSFSAEENSLFLVPTPTVAILSFHEQFSELLKREGVEVGEPFLPGSWFPHCLVAQDVSKALLSDAFHVLREFKLPLSGDLFDIGLVEYSPAREHFSFPLGNEGD